MANLALRIKSKSGQQLLKTLNSENTIKDLKQKLSEISNIPINRLYVLSGYPPKALDMSKDTLLLCNSGITSGDTLILEERVETSIPEKIEIESKISDELSQNPVGVLMKKDVPADNSCLFSSIYFVLNGRLDDTGTMAPLMRGIIAEIVSKDQDNYNDAILGKPNSDYCAWIQNDNSWGGAIELSVLSNYYGIEIAVVDTINAIINRFGEDQHYGQRVFLMFDGIHYDPLYLEPYDGSILQTIFPIEDLKILDEAKQLAKEANSSKQFTDVNKFTLKCLVCNIFLCGQVKAQEHAQQTGHMKFGEV